MLLRDSLAADAWMQPSHDHGARRPAAAWQRVPLDGGICKGERLIAGLSRFARKGHPLANDDASYIRLGHD
jgi:hypothetical protein